MKLYYVVGSGNCRKVLATIRHLELDVAIEYMDFFAGELFTPEYLSLNPNGRVPTLTDGDFILWESNAIMQYVADKVPGNTLLPQNPRTRADIVRWQCWELAHFNNAFSTLAYESIIKPNFMQQSTNEALVRVAQESLAEFAKVLDTHLTDRRFVVGNDITLADYSIIHIENFKDDIPFDWTPYPQVNEYFARMCDTPHWASTAPLDPATIGRKPSST